MSLAVDARKCKFFVGGNAAKTTNPAGSLLAGGCTKAWWDSQPGIDTVAGKETAMAKLMSATGVPIVSNSECMLVEGNSSRARLKNNTAPIFLNKAEAGMLVYLPDSDDVLFSGEGIYEIAELDAWGV